MGTTNLSTASRDPVIENPVIENPGVIVIAGGGDIDPILEVFADMAGGRASTLVIIPSASKDPDAGSYPFRILSPRTDRQVRILRTPDNLNLLDGASGVWIGGGDQVDLMNIFYGSSLVNDLRSIYKRGGVIGGTSAGASVLGTVMPYNNGWEYGWGLIDGCIVDQHFTQRRRIDRLNHLVDAFPSYTGIGIDENTAVVIKGRHMKVIGEGRVIIISEPLSTKKQSVR